LVTPGRPGFGGGLVGEVDGVWREEDIEDEVGFGWVIVKGLEKRMNFDRWRMEDRKGTWVEDRTIIFSGKPWIKGPFFYFWSVQW
jgi:hypothetical protein